MPVEPGEAVLDLGTGSGYAAKALSDAAEAGQAVGVDAAPEMARTARTRTDDPAVEFVASDFHDLPLESGSFDHCFSMEAFFFATDPIDVLEEVLRVLRPAGRSPVASTTIRKTTTPTMLGSASTRRCCSGAPSSTGRRFERPASTSPPRTTSPTRTRKFHQRRCSPRPSSKLARRWSNDIGT